MNMAQPRCRPAVPLVAVGCLDPDFASGAFRDLTATLGQWQSPRRFFRCRQACAPVRALVYAAPRAIASRRDRHSTRKRTGFIGPTTCRSWSMIILAQRCNVLWAGARLRPSTRSTAPSPRRRSRPFG